MKLTTCAAALIALALTAAVATSARAAGPVHTPPLQLVVTPPPVQTDDATYQFQVVMSDIRVVRGVPQLLMTVSAVRQPQGIAGRSRDQVSFSSIYLTVLQDASSARVKIDGLEFVLEANYPDPFDKSGTPRAVTTTFAEMFGGGRVGLAVRLAN